MTTVDKRWINTPEVDKALGKLTDALVAAARADGGPKINAIALCVCRHDTAHSGHIVSIKNSGDTDENVAFAMITTLAKAYGAKVEEAQEEGEDDTAPALH